MGEQMKKEGLTTVDKYMGWAQDGNEKLMGELMLGEKMRWN
jgi:hypothetical protein